MGELARSVHEHGGRIFGAIPRTLVDRELAYGPADELVVTDTLRERKDTFLVNHFPLRGRWGTCPANREAGAPAALAGSEGRIA